MVVGVRNVRPDEIDDLESPLSRHPVRLTVSETSDDPARAAVLSH